MNFDTHLCLVSAQATPNLLPALDASWHPRRVVLLVSPDMASQAEALAGVLRRRGIEVERRNLDDAYDYHHIYAACFEFVDDAKGEVALNVTGGTKIMALAAREAFRDAGKRVFYVDVETDEVIVIGERERGAPLSSTLGLTDLLEAHGYAYVADQRPRKPDVSRTQSDRMHELVDGVDRFGEALGAINAIATRAKGTLRASLDQAARPLACMDEVLGLFEEWGQLKRAPGAIQFPDETARQFVCGGWLELHVFKTVADLAGAHRFSDYGMNFAVVAPDGLTRNEIDVAFLHRNSLYLIECKAANLGVVGASGDDKGTEAIYKLETLRKLGGGRTHAMLVDYRGRLSVKRSRGDHQRVAANRARASAADIKLVSGSEIRNLRDAIRAWIGA